MKPSKIAASILFARRNRVYSAVGTVVSLSWLSIAFFDPDQRGNLSENIGLSYIFGATFGHATLAAAWTAFGPGRLIWRLPFSLAWIFLLGVAIGIQVEVNGGPDEAAFVIGGCAFVQWLALQFALWGMRLGFGAHLRHCDDPQAPDAAVWQFGIRQLMIITAIVSVAFGIGRLVVEMYLPSIPGSGMEPFFLFLAVSAIVFSIPLLFAALLERWAVAGVLIVLVLIGVGTTLEATLMNQLSIGAWFKVYDLLWVNGSTSGLVLAVAAIVRLCRYSLTRVQTVKP